MPGVLLDAGPLVAYLYPRDTYHDWAVEQFDLAIEPFLTCEPVLTEACFLTVRNGQTPARVLWLLSSGVLRIAFNMEEELPALHALIERYGNVPMSLADACLVRMAERMGLSICTLDFDFTVYRVHGRNPLHLISPPGYRNLHQP